MNIKNPLDKEFLTVDDITLAPRLGILDSRSEAELKPYIYSAPMDRVTGFDLTKAMLEASEYPVVSRFINSQELYDCLSQFASNTNTFFAIGIDNSLKKFLELIAEIAEDKSWEDSFKINVALDVAHGDMKKAHATTAVLKSYPFVNKIMSGSICTPDAAIRCIESGCTHLRVGVGSGSACTTRQMTGIGLSNLTSVYLIHKITKDLDIPVEIIADGGIKYPGDAVKYLAGGATGVMLGNVLSHAQESPGWHLDGTGHLWKTYRGQASAEFQQELFGTKNHCPEGASGSPFIWNGTTVESIVNQFRGGLSSAISYLGLKSIIDLKPENVTFIKTTYSGYTEGNPHGVHYRK